MPVSKFKFVSPGVQVAEIDNSQLPRLPEEMGPVIIGRAQRGPGMRPVKVDSFSDFVEIFGNPQAGGAGTDVWRNGGAGLSPTYGVYAAQAYLRNSSPLTFVRLLGKAHPDKTSAGNAGWSAGDITTRGDGSGGSYGLFVMPKTNKATGTLAAVFYLTTGSIALKGQQQYSGSKQATISGTCGLLQADAGGWQINIYSAHTAPGAGAATETISFNFDENSKDYIRKVFNTNPTLTNSSVVSSTKSYWLGETFDRSVTDASIGSTPLAIILPLLSGAVGGTQYEQDDQTRSATKAETPWIFSQDLAGDSSIFNYQKLFKFRTLDAGEWEQKNLKVSIADVKASSDPTDPYGTFTVEVRSADDSDNAKKVIERFSRCSLNPNSSNYIAKRIGDMYVTWDYGERRYREYGNYPNQSRYLYAVMNTEVDDAAVNETYLPFGFEGPVRWKSFILESGTLGGIKNDGLTEATNRFVSGATVAVKPVDSIAAAQSVFFSTSSTATVQTCSMEYPKVPLRTSSRVGKLSSPKDAYFGADTTMTTSTRFDKSYQDVVRAIGPASLDATGDATISAQEFSYIFTMEDLTYYTGSAASGSTLQPTASGMTSSTDVYYFSGSRAQGNSIAVTGGLGTGSWNNVLTAGYDSFTIPLHGGFDGLNIKEIEPFRNTTLSDKSELTSYAFNSVKVAIDSCADPEVVECNLMSVPGITNTALTEHVIKVCEDRADALAVIDITNGYVPPSENTSTEESRAGNVASAVTAMENRGLNSSYGCAYYPWVRARDSETGKGFWCPPSVAAIGTFSSAQNKSEVWFAPAGFTRGGLTEGAGGIPVINVKQRLTSKQRDSLYEVNINPIASFPAEGIVVFGQKTLQTTPSALDRVNVRRLMIHVKKEISRIAARLLFDQNVQTTWDRFTGQVVPFLDSIKSRLGLTDYKVILDDTTTTPDLIDRNIMYAKIFLKPAQAIEFIAIDFVITSTGASFED
jgi:hypothetical protein